MFRRSSGIWILVLSLTLLAAAGLGAWQAAETLLLNRTISEGRTVADIAENIGRWASRYSGLHARTEGVNAPMPGSFLTRSTYALTEGDQGVLQGVRAQDRQDEKEAMQRVEIYHWKNPALIQREMADQLIASGSRSQYRLTARTVLNPNNAPSEFEIEALDSIQKAFASAKSTHVEAELKQSLKTMYAEPSTHPLEYWRVEPKRLHYARAVIAQESCLKCHGSAANAPDFLRVNSQFNGGGGFGYKVGEPIGVISVTVPMSPLLEAAKESLSTSSLIAFGLVLVSALGLLGIGLMSALRGATGK